MFLFLANTPIVTVMVNCMNSCVHSLNPTFLIVFVLFVNEVIVFKYVLTVIVPNDGMFYYNHICIQCRIMAWALAAETQESDQLGGLMKKLKQLMPNLPWLEVYNI